MTFEFSWQWDRWLVGFSFKWGTYLAINLLCLAWLWYDAAEDL
jgi:hypothetical protein